jgi:hypothetical protein
MTAKRTDKRSLVSRVLGPADPELGCEQCFEQLDRYVELELAGEPADDVVLGMRAHLEGCSACSEEHESLRALLAEEARVSRRED